MEPIKCPGCSRLASAKLNECPFCHHTLQGVKQSSASMRAVKPVPCPHCTRLIAKSMSSCPFCKKDVSFAEEGEGPTSCPTCGRPYQLKHGACPFCHREGKAQKAPPEPKASSPSKPPSVFPPAHARPSSKPPGSAIVSTGADEPTLITVLAPALGLAVLGAALGLYAMSTDRSLGPHWISPASKAVAFLGGILAVPLFLRSRGASIRTKLEDDGRAWAFPVILVLVLGLSTIAFAGIGYGAGMIVNGVGRNNDEEVVCTATSSTSASGKGQPWETDFSCSIHGEYLTMRVDLMRDVRPQVGETMPVKVKRGRLGVWLRAQ